MSIYEIIPIDDDLYGGELKDGKPHGRGILKYFYNVKPDGKYVGEFKDGKRAKAPGPCMMARPMLGKGNMTSFMAGAH